MTAPRNGPRSSTATSPKSPEDLDRELNELLQELRVIVAGVQVLFAFLLTVAFTNRFASADDMTEAIYFVAFLSTALASILTIAPSVQHRMRWREYDKEQLLRSSNRMIIAASVLIAVAIDAAVLLVARELYGALVGGICAGVVGATAVLLWWATPLWRKFRAGAGPHGSTGTA